LNIVQKRLTCESEGCRKSAGAETGQSQ
jgi:hypothetical protein